MAGIEMGEVLLGAYLDRVVGCGHVQYNVRVPGGGTWIQVGKLLGAILSIDGVEVVANQDYARRIDDLVGVARKDHSASGNDAFRVLQIVGALRR